MKDLLQALFFCFLVTPICFGQWVQVGLNNESIKDIAVHNSNIFAVTSVTSNSGMLYRSIDNGANWTIIVDSYACEVTISPTENVFMLKDTVVNPPYGHHKELHYSTDYGNTWIRINLFEQVGYYHDLLDIIVSPSGTLFCGMYDITSISGESWSSYFANSTDEGLTWTTPGRSIEGGKCFDFSAQFAITSGSSTYHSTMYLSSDYGSTWDSTCHLNSMLGTLGIFSNGNIIVGGSSFFDSSRILISTDMCSTWTQISSLNTQVGLSYSSGSLEGMIIGTDIGIFLFSDEGDSLGSWNEGLTNLNVKALTLDNNGYVYAGTENGVWRRPLSEILTAVENESIRPTEYILSQNYPNPFNPSTKIKYSVPQTSLVQIKIFDVLANEIETLVNEEKQVGTYELNWNMANLPTGVYFYRIQAGNFIETKKMILLK